MRFAYPRSYRPDFAILGIRALGPEARTAIPALVKMIGKEHDAQWAAYALCTIGPEGTAGLSEALERIDDFARANVLLGLQHGIWPDREADVASILLERLTDDPSATVRGSAASVLSKFTLSAALVVPVLARALHDRDQNVRFRAAESLTFFGAEAAPALPALKAALSDESPIVRDFAAKVIRQIGAAGNEKAQEEVR
jgi:HEAT repeat protein